MKVKVTSLMLATLMACTLVQPSQAVQPQVQAQTQTQTTESVVEPVGSVEELRQLISAEATAARKAAENIQHPQGMGLYLDSVALLQVQREWHNGEYYVAVDSFLAATQPQAVVTEVEGGITVSASTGSETLEMSVYDGASYVVANDRYLYLKQGVVNLDGHLAIPVGTMAKILNLNQVWDEETGYVRLYTQQGQAYITPGSVYYNSDDFYWLSRIISTESGNQPLAGKIAVGNVVMNRVASHKFPNTVKGVIFQPNQFTPAYSGAIYRNPNWDSQVAAKLVLDGAVVLDNALFFNVAGLSSYASQNRAHVATIGAHAFYA